MTDGANRAALRPQRGIEERFDVAFASELALREKQIQQSYRPVIGVHKWFARRPGTLFRSLLLAEFTELSLREAFWRSHDLSGVIADPFMGGGTPLFEANRLGLNVVGCDINPMAHWIVQQSLVPLDLREFSREAAGVAEDVEADVGPLYRTECECCGGLAHVKYFLWVKTASCPHCGAENDLFPGYRLAEAVRHPRHVLACAECGALGEYDVPPTREHPARCRECAGAVHIEGNVVRRRLSCRKCQTPFSIATFSAPPIHRMWAIEYHCERCYGAIQGRQYKRPDPRDVGRFCEAEGRLHRSASTLPIPDDPIPSGDESDRLHRWGYYRYREMFGARQLLGLGTLLARIQTTPEPSIRHALSTVFSDSLRYQNMLCRYDTYALKCQDIFSVHGFPVGLIQCENALLGLRGVGSGAFRHFVEKYVRAKRYCQAPFETRGVGNQKRIVPIPGETIEASLVDHAPDPHRGKQAFLINAPSQNVPLRRNSLDGVFTDPPYFDNVQYAELIDFCYSWLRQALRHEQPSFARASTRSSEELTANATLGRGLEHFAGGLSEVFQHFARALKPGAPFVFTYHHNEPAAYLPLVLAILDSGLECTATLPAAGEMAASLHIAGTTSSVLDSVFVCRKPRSARVLTRGPRQLDQALATECRAALENDAARMREAGVRLTVGDLRCLLAGHVARIAIGTLMPEWSRRPALDTRLRRARTALESIATVAGTEVSLTRIAELHQRPAK